MVTTPIERNSVINTPAVQLRPASTDDGAGNPIQSGTDAFVANVVAGVIPPNIQNNPYRDLAGGALNLSRWLVVVRGALNFAVGDAISVPTGVLKGKYRVELVEQVPNQTLVLGQCHKES